METSAQVKHAVAMGVVWCACVGGDEVGGGIQDGKGQSWTRRVPEVDPGPSTGKIRASTLRSEVARSNREQRTESQPAARRVWVGQTQGRRDAGCTSFALPASKCRQAAQRAMCRLCNVRRATCEDEKETMKGRKMDDDGLMGDG